MTQRLSFAIHKATLSSQFIVDASSSCICSVADLHVCFLRPATDSMHFMVIFCFTCEVPHHLHFFLLCLTGSLQKTTRTAATVVHFAHRGAQLWPPGRLMSALEMGRRPRLADTNHFGADSVLNNYNHEML